jgi:hypothetical protein
VSIIDGHLEVVVSRSALLAAIDRADGPRREFTVETMADDICRAFCTSRKLRPAGGLQLEIHRRQHVEIAQAIFDARKE